MIYIQRNLDKGQKEKNRRIFLFDKNIKIFEFNILQTIVN
jgi:hypothetical protein